MEEDLMGGRFSFLSVSHRREADHPPEGRSEQHELLYGIGWEGERKEDVQRHMEGDG
jgi:hypothetical protein